MASKDLLPANAATTDFREHVVEYIKNNITHSNEINSRFKTFFESGHNKTYICGVSFSEGFLTFFLKIFNYFYI